MSTKIVDKSNFFSLIKVHSSNILDLFKFDQAEVQGQNMLRTLFQKTLFIGRLSYSATVKDLQTAFPKVTKIDLPKNFNGESRGFAFLTVEDDVAQEYITSPPEVAGSSVVVQESIKKPRTTPEATPSKTLYFGNLPSSISQEELKKIAPNSVGVRVMKNENGHFAFIEFESTSDAQEILNSNTELTLDGKDIRVNFGRERQSRDNRF